MSKFHAIQKKRSAHRVPNQRTPAADTYSERPYEHRLVTSGRRVINVDIDATLIEEIDKIRGKDRRGLILDRLLQVGIKAYQDPEPMML